MVSVRFWVIITLAFISTMVLVSATCEKTGWLDEKNKYCCDGVVMDVTKETCCNDNVYSGTEWISCGKECIKEDSSTKCCDGKTYDNNVNSCCNRKIYNGSNWAPCGNGCYNRDTEKCCYGVVAYDNQYCEDGKIFNITRCEDTECPNGKECCGDLGCYDPDEQVCEKGVLRQICHQDVCEPNEKCCWNVGCYDHKNTGVLKYPAMQYHEMRLLVHNKTHHFSDNKMNLDFYIHHNNILGLATSLGKWNDDG